MGDELRDRLDRLADRSGADEPGALDRWDAARERRRSARRFGTGVLAFAVAIAGIGGAWFALGRGGDADAGPGTLLVVTQGPMSVWPETPLSSPTALADAQRSATQTGRRAWRLDPAEVISRFSQSVLGWGAVDVDLRRTTEGVAVYHVAPRVTVLMKCPRSGPCPWAPEVFVAVAQLARHGDRGIWSVVSVESPNLHLPVAVADAVVAGEPLDVTMQLADLQHAAVGFAYSLQTSVATGEECPPRFVGAADVTEPQIRLQVPNPLFPIDRCDQLGATGYVFAYTTPELTVQTGDPLVESAAITEVSIVPVRFVSASAESPAPTGSPPRTGASDRTPTP
jgi:hypothetical protein